MKPKRSTDTIRLIQEALALEAAGGTWTQPHAAAVTGYSVASIRASECPKHHEQSPTAVTKPRVVYFPAEVRAWKAGLLKKSA